MTDKERKEIFSKNLLRVLNEHDKNQVDVAKAIGVSQQTFNTWCRGVALPRMGKIQLLADYFRIDMSELISDKTTAASMVNIDTKKEELMRIYDLLNDEGRDRLMELARYYSSRNEYKRLTDSEDLA